MSWLKLTAFFATKLQETEDDWFTFDVKTISSQWCWFLMYCSAQRRRQLLSKQMQFKFSLISRGHPVLVCISSPTLVFHALCCISWHICSPFKLFLWLWQFFQRCFAYVRYQPVRRSVRVWQPSGYTTDCFGIICRFES